MENINTCQHQPTIRCKRPKTTHCKICDAQICRFCGGLSKNHFTQQIANLKKTIKRLDAEIAAIQERLRLMEMKEDA